MSYFDVTSSFIGTVLHRKQFRQGKNVITIINPPSSKRQNARHPSLETDNNTPAIPFDECSPKLLRCITPRYELIFINTATPTTTSAKIAVMAAVLAFHPTLILLNGAFYRHHDKRMYATLLQSEFPKRYAKHPDVRELRLKRKMKDELQHAVAQILKKLNYTRKKQAQKNIAPKIEISLIAVPCSSKYLFTPDLLISANSDTKQDGQSSLQDDLINYIKASPDSYSVTLKFMVNKTKEQTTCQRPDFLQAQDDFIIKTEL